jgi:hypothetical protein
MIIVESNGPFPLVCGDCGNRFEKTVVAGMRPICAKCGGANTVDFRPDFGLNTVNGSRHTAWGHNSEVGFDFHEDQDPEYIDPRDYEDDPWSEDDGDEDDIPQRWEASRHTAGTMADGKTPVRQHKFKEDSNWGDESGCTVCGQSKGHSNHTDRAQATSLLEERYATVRRLSSLRHFAASCDLCGQDHATDEHPSYDDIQARGYDVFGEPLARDLGEVGNRIDRRSTYHFAEDEEDPEGYEKQPKGLGDQVDTGTAPSSEIQDPNPLAGQDLERTPRNLAEAALWAQAGASCEQCGAPLHSYQSPCPNCDADPDYPQDTPHDQLDDPWNGQENPLGRGWGDPPLGY